MSNNLADAQELLQSDKAAQATIEQSACNQSEWLGIHTSRRRSNLGFIRTDTLQLENFALLHGGNLPPCSVNFNCYGTSDKPVLLVLGGISASRNIHEWWTTLWGSQQLFDLEKYYIIGMDYIADSNSESVNLISTFDQAKVINQLLQQLNINKLEAIVGGSYGGMVAQAFAAVYPQKLNKLVAIAAAHTNTQRSIALRQIQQQILHLGQKVGRASEAVSIARQIGCVTYRSEHELENRFEPLRQIEGQTLTFDIVKYLKHQGEKFAAYFDSDRYRSLSQSIDLHRVNPKDIVSDALFIGIESDQLVPSELVRECASLCKGKTHFYSIDSEFGHDGFLLEGEQLTKLISKFLRE